MVNIEKLNVILIFLIIIFAAYMLIFDTQHAHASSIQSVENIHLYSAATETPFQPVDATETPTPSMTPTITETPIPSATPLPTETPTPVPWQDEVSMPDGQINLLILGSDVREDGNIRTDVIILVMVNPDRGTVSLVSFPRDLFITIPGYGGARINSAYTYGGFNLLADTFETNFGVRPEYFMMTDFHNFIEIINMLGGLDVEVEEFLEDKCDLPQQVDTYCAVEPGTIQMDAETALWYVRSRKTSSDLDRIRRQQEVLKAMTKKVFSLDVLTQAPAIYNRFINYVDTNLDYEAVMRLAFAAVHMNGEDSVKRYLIGPTEVYDYVTGAGAMVLMPDMYAVMDVINRAVEGQ